MTPKKQTLLIIDALKEQYPQAICSLEYSENAPYRLLISVRLAAQCTDARVNIVTEELFRLYPTVQSLAEASVDEIEAIVRPCGLGHSKARDVVAACKMLVEQHDGAVPDTMDALLALPGVGRKSANLILGDIYGQPAVVCDTHCIRITNLLGLTDSKNPAICEKQLRALLPPEESNDFCHRLVLHGRAVCKARNPHCALCTLRALCAHARAQRET